MKITYLRIIAAILIAIALVVGGGGYYAYSRFHAPGPQEQAEIVLIPQGASVGQAARTLQDAGVITSSDLFKWGTRFLGADRDIRAGEYEVPAHTSMAGILDILRSGDVVQHAFTVAEGLSSAQVVALLEADDTLTGAIDAIPPEGTLLPETYLHVRGTPRAEIIARMSSAFKQALDELWAARDADRAPKTPEQAVTLASIVEKETALAGERPRVAAVFLNRLNKGMRLQSDPTVVYAVTGGFPIGRRITRDDLRMDSPYNTYRNHGLPPGPIANPGVQSLKAVLNPIVTDDYYFVADGTGGHVFSRTLEEHNRNVAKWRKIRRQMDADMDADVDKEADASSLGGQTTDQPVE